VLNSHGALMDEIAEPGQAAGRHSPSYLGRDSSGHLLPAGNYPILIVASNSQGSATAQVTLTISGP
jgi:flagellar hook assembly protein FlgD